MRWVTTAGSSECTRASVWGAFIRAGVGRARFGTASPVLLFLLYNESALACCKRSRTRWSRAFPNRVRRKLLIGNARREAGGIQQQIGKKRAKIVFWRPFFKPLGRLCRVPNAAGCVSGTSASKITSARNTKVERRAGVCVSSLAPP